MKIDWQLLGEGIAIGITLGYAAYDLYVDWRISRKSFEEQKTSKYVGWFSFMTVYKANDGKLYFGDKPWLNKKTLEKKVTQQ